MVSYRETPEGTDLNRRGVTPAPRMPLEADAFKLLLEESAAEIEALRSALGS